MSDLNDDAFARMTAHMNDDHPDAVAAYARYYGKLRDVRAARIVEFDARGITLEVESDSDSSKVRIPFDHELVDRKDARATLVAMAETATAK